MKKVLIVGGTHGNEWTGVAVVKHYESYFKKRYPELELHFIHANPEAFAINKRFKDEDLNRAFQFLGHERPTYEWQRARDLKILISAEDCFVIDLHTTTSNMGKTLIVTHYNPMNLSICEAITSTDPETKVIGSPDPTRKYLVSQSDFGLMIEVGPVANGVIEPHTLKETLLLLDGILSEVARPPSATKGSLALYEEVEDVYYPQDSTGQVIGFVHSEFQGKDFTPLTGEYAAFETFAGTTLKKDVPETLYPIFINEAAYYPTKLAYTLCRKINLTF